MIATARPRVGVLALQGGVAEHLLALRDVGAEPVPVRRRAELDSVDALVLPGGESTTMGHLLGVFDLLDPLRARVGDGMPVFGSCAGMILLADDVRDTRAGALGVGGLDVTVRRNAFGRQVDSFETDLELRGLTAPVHAVFIRAPWVERVGPGVEVLGTVPPGHGAASGKVVAVRSGPLLATSFHPEVTADLRVHAMFLSMVRGAGRQDLGSLRSSGHNTPTVRGVRR